MKANIHLNYSENVRQVAEEEKISFLRNLLEQMNLPVEEVWSDDMSLSIEQKIKLRNFLTKWEIRVISDNEGGMQVLNKDNLIGNWKPPTYKVKQDLQESDPKKQFYLEMTVDYFSIFEEQQA